MAALNIKTIKPAGGGDYTTLQDLWDAIKTEGTYWRIDGWFI